MDVKYGLIQAIAESVKKHTQNTLDIEMDTAPKTPRPHAQPARKKTKKTSKFIMPFLLVAVIVGGAFYGYSWYVDRGNKNSEAIEVILNQNIAPDEPQKSGELITFSGEEFKNLYNNYAYPNTQYIAEDAVITGNVEADAVIQKMAEDRGYVRRSAPVQDTFREVEPNMFLQQRAAEPYEDLQAAAKNDGLDFFLTAAYRSAQEQRTIFLERTQITPDIISNIATGSLNTKINEILASTAIPGYSRHHTGYTIDIGCGNNPDTAFEFTVCFEWLSADNYKNAKTFGWIPSYPEGAGEQGPEPETWEYVWVGTDAVTK